MALSPTWSTWAASLAGSMRETVPSRSLTTQTKPPPASRALGRPGRSELRLDPRRFRVDHADRVFVQRGQEVGLRRAVRRIGGGHGAERQDGTGGREQPTPAAWLRLFRLGNGARVVA